MPCNVIASIHGLKRISGPAASLFRPLAMAYVFAILASMLVALTLTPALALMLLPKAAERARSPLAQELQRRYRELLPRMIHRPRWAIGILAGAFAADVGGSGTRHGISQASAAGGR